MHRAELACARQRHEKKTAAAIEGPRGGGNRCPDGHGRASAVSPIGGGGADDDPARARARGVGGQQKTILITKDGTRF